MSPRRPLHRPQLGWLVLLAVFLGGVMVGRTPEFLGKRVRRREATFVALYAVALLLRRLRRWQGRQTALASLAGLGAILFSLVAVNLFFTGFHGFL